MASTSSSCIDHDESSWATPRSARTAGPRSTRTVRSRTIRRSASSSPSTSTPTRGVRARPTRSSNVPRRCLSERGHVDPVLWVFEANTRARRFYERHGWSFDGVASAIAFGDAHPADLRYRKNLTS